MSNSTSSTTVPGGFDFTATPWTTVLAAGEGGAPQADAALERLCRAYWYPLYAYIRRRGVSAADAEDLASGAVRVAVHRLRQRYRELARVEITATVGSLSEVEDELGLLLQAIRG